MTTWNIRGDRTDYFTNTDDIVVDFCGKDGDSPLNWLNWVSLDMDELNDAIHMYLSTGDPRGAQFSVSLTRDKKHADDAKFLIFDTNFKDTTSPILDIKMNGKQY